MTMNLVACCCLLITTQKKSEDNDELACHCLLQVQPKKQKMMTTLKKNPRRKMYLHPNTIVLIMFTTTTLFQQQSGQQHCSTNSRSNNTVLPIVIPIMIGLTTIVVISFNRLNIDDIEVESKHWWTLKTCKANMNINLIPNWKYKETLNVKKYVEDIHCLGVFSKMLHLLLLRFSSCSNSLFFFEHRR